MAPRWLSDGQAWGRDADGSFSMRALVGIALVIFVLGTGAGYTLQAATSGGSEKPTKQSSENPVIDPTLAAMATAPQTDEGAVRAVTSYITGFPALALVNSQQQQQQLDEILSPTADPNLRTDLVRVLSNARDRLIGPGSVTRVNTARLVTAPASYKVDMLSPTEARVQVWFLTVYVDSSGQRAESSWSTNDIRVQWSDHWRLATFAGKTGPTPALFGNAETPSTYAEVASVFNGFKAYRYATAATTSVNAG